MALHQYQNNSLTIPKYLFIIDDDTYMNMDLIVDLLLKDFSFDEPHVVAGCNYIYLKAEKMTYPYGGFGTILSRASIQRLLHPINCTDARVTGEDMDPFSRLTCWRLEQNHMGEKQFFSNGMNILQLMHTFSSEQSFLNVPHWHEDAGYCFHSDHYLAYFMNMYHIAVPEREYMDGFRKNYDFRNKYAYTGLHSGGNEFVRGECYNLKQNCSIDNAICHYTQPTQMFDLFRKSLE
jgi:hypothetical protein